MKIIEQSSSIIKQAIIDSIRGDNTCNFIYSHNLFEYLRTTKDFNLFFVDKNEVAYKSEGLIRIFFFIKEISAGRVRSNSYKNTIYKPTDINYLF